MSRFHFLPSEENRLRRWSLYIFARYIEMPALRWAYHLLRGSHRRWGQKRVVRSLLGWGLAAPFAYAGDTSRPLPVDEALRLIDELSGPIAVGPCRCRTAHAGCDHPTETDLVIRTGVKAWTRAFPGDYRQITKAEAKAVITRCHALGMWQMVFIHCPVNAHRDPEATENEYVICNCCRCGCVPYILNRELGQRTYPFLPGRFVAETNLESCKGHGDCVAACPFGVRAVRDGLAHLVSPCFGCGACVASCPESAIRMWPRIPVPRGSENPREETR